MNQCSIFRSLSTEVTPGSSETISMQELCADDMNIADINECVTKKLVDLK